MAAATANGAASPSSSASAAPSALRLDARELGPAVEHRREQLTEHRVGERGLALEADGAQHEHALGGGLARHPSRALFPAPGAPCTTRTPLRPCRAASSNSRICARSRWRPTSMPGAKIATEGQRARWGKPPMPSPGVPFRVRSMNRTRLLTTAFAAAALPAPAAAQADSIVYLDGGNIVVRRP